VRFYLVIEVTSVITEMFFFMYSLRSVFDINAVTVWSFSPASRNEIWTRFVFEKGL